MGYAQQAGGGRSGDLLVVDWAELEQPDTLSDVAIRRFKAKEVPPVKLLDFVFPVAAGRLKQTTARTSKPPKSRRLALGPKAPAHRGPTSARESPRGSSAERFDIRDNVVPKEEEEEEEENLVVENKDY